MPVYPKPPIDPFEHLRGDMTAEPCLDRYLEQVPTDHAIRTAPTLEASRLILAACSLNDPLFQHLAKIHRHRFVLTAAARAKLPPPAPVMHFKQQQRKPSEELCARMERAPSHDDAEAIIARLTEQHENIPSGVITGLMEIYCRRFPYRHISTAR